MAENQSKCTGNCMACTIFQRQYCASQLAYSNMRMLEQVQQVVGELKDDMKAVSEKVEAMQNNEALLIDPMKPADNPSTEAQNAAAPTPAVPQPRIAR